MLKVETEWCAVGVEVKAENRSPSDILVFRDPETPCYPCTQFQAVAHEQTQSSSHQINGG